MDLLCVVSHTTVGTIFYSQGRPDIQLKWAIFVVPVVAIAFFIGLKWNIQGVATAYAIVSGILWLISHKIANKLIELKMKNFLVKLYPAALASFGMLTILFVYEHIQKVFIGMGDTYFLFTSILIGITAYCILVKLLKIEEVNEIFDLMRAKLNLRLI